MLRRSGIAARLPGLLAVLAAGATLATARSEAVELDVLETEDLRLLYLHPFQTYLVPHVARTFQNSLAIQERVFDWKPYEKTNVLLLDIADYGNAGASASPVNSVSVFIAPPVHTLETLPGSERMYSTMNHEMVHVANFDAANEQDLRWRKFFGGKPRHTDEHPETILYNYLTVPRLSVPRWYLEGAASFMETWMAGGIGRAQGAYDEMVFRAMVRDDAHFFSNLGLVSKGVAVDFQTGSNAYLYGTRFMSYLAYVYSPQQVVEWLKRGEDSDRYYASQFERVFGKTIETAWDEWIDWEHGFQAANLSRVREHPLTPVRRLTKQGLGSVSRSYYDPETDSLIGAYQYPGVIAYAGVLSLRDGTARRLTDIKGPMEYRVTSTAYDPASKSLFYTADNHDFRDLMVTDVATGKTRRLLEDARIGDLAFDQSDRSLWGLRHQNGYVTLVKIPHPYESWTQVYTWPYGFEPFELDVSADGSMLSMSVGEIDGSQFMRVFRTADVTTGKVEPIAQFDFGRAIPEGFVFTPDGKYLYGSSYYTGVSNIFRYEIATGEIEAVSNAETGFFRPIPMPDGKLIVLEYTGEGFAPVVIDPRPLEDLGAITFLGSEIAKKHLVVKEWVVAAPSSVDLDSLVTRRGKYNPLRELEYGSGYPIIEGYRDSVALGWNMRFEDPAKFNRIDVAASYSWDQDLPDGEKPHFSIRYEGLDWKLEYWHNDADFYDLFGPTKRSRKGDAFIAEYDKSLIYDDPRKLELTTRAAYYTGLDTMPNNQNVPTSFANLAAVSARLAYTNTRRSQGSVDHEKGWRWKLAASAEHADGETVPQIAGGLDFGFPLPLKNSSVWLYSSGGFANGDRDNTLANFYFGGFGNNYVDDGDIKRYREYYSFPGFEIDEISGQNFAKSVLELNLPPVRFEEVGTPALFLTWLRPAFFAGALVTDPDNDTYRRTVYNAGVQVDLKFTLVHRLPMTLSFGYAAGFEDGDKLDDEWMLSLKIL